MSLEHGFERFVEQPKPPFTDPVVSVDGNVVLCKYRPEDIPEAFALVDADRDRFSRKGIAAGIYLTSRRLMEGEYVNLNPKNNLNLAIRNREHVYVGHLRLTRFMRNPDVGGLYYYLGAEHEGHGYMASAVRTVTDIALGEMGFDEVQGAVFPDNKKSGTVLEAAGFQKVETKPDMLRFSRKRSDTEGPVL